MRKRSIIAGIMTLLVFSGGAVALWLSGFNITGTATFAGGSPEDPQICITSFTGNASNVTRSCGYENDDGNATLQFSCSYDFVSDDSRCTVEEQEDYKIFLGKTPTGTFYDCETSPSFLFPEGVSDIHIRIVPDGRACPIDNQTLTVTGIIV